MRQLRPYKIGLAIIGLFTLAIFLFVGVRAVIHKQDLKTTRAANDIAVKLNDYVYAKQAIPGSLRDAGVQNTPQAIRYQAISDTGYKFCITYKAAKGADLMTNPYTRFYYANTETLDIPPTHKKGENCQTITPYLVGQYSDEQTSVEEDSNAPYRTCDTGYNYAWTFLNVTKLEAQTDEQPARITIQNYPTESSYNVSSRVKVFDKNCNAITLQDIRAGDTVGLYFYPYGEPVTMIVKN